MPEPFPAAAPAAAAVSVSVPAIEAAVAATTSAAPTAALAQAETFHGQPCLRLQLPCGDSALVALHGAQVLSWVASGRERLYLSPQAVFDGQAAIRGGIPLCFPQFNQRGPLAKHGFARNLPWQAVAGALPGHALLRLTDSAQTHAWWPHAFEAELALTLSPGALLVALSVRNTGAAPWDFTTALHTYLRVDDIAHVQVEGLDGCARWDAVTDTHSVQQGALRFVGEFDSVYQAAPGALQMHQMHQIHQMHEGSAHTLTVEQSASCASTVVWNPGAALGARLADMPAGGHAHMLCIEAAQIDTPVHLPPGTVWTGWQRLSAVAPASAAVVP